MSVLLIRLCTFFGTAQFFIVYEPIVSMFNLVSRAAMLVSLGPWRYTKMAAPYWGL